jgi:hypothetical protein
VLPPLFSVLQSMVFHPDKGNTKNIKNFKKNNVVRQRGAVRQSSTAGKQGKTVIF